MKSGWGMGRGGQDQGVLLPSTLSEGGKNSHSRPRRGSEDKAKLIRSASPLHNLSLVSNTKLLFGFLFVLLQIAKLVADGS